MSQDDVIHMLRAVNKNLDTLSAILMDMASKTIMQEVYITRVVNKLIEREMENEPKRDEQ